MTTIRVVSSSVLLAACSFAATAVAQAPAAPKPAAPMAAPPAAPKPMAAPAAKPAAPAAPVAAPAKAAPAAPATGAPAAAPVAAAPPMPTPSKELEAFMKGFEGNWKCETKFAAGSMGPGSPEMTAKTSVKIKKEFGGMSWHGEYTMAKSKTMPAMSGVFQLGFDPGTNQSTIVAYDSMGTAAMGAGPITGDTVVYTEDAVMMGMKTKLRETMTKKGPKELFHKYEVDMGKGFQAMGEDTCKK